MIARIFQSIFNSPAGAIGGAVVVDLFFSHERAQKMGIWTYVLLCHWEGLRSADMFAGLW